jgi:WD40 repeat protein
LTEENLFHAALEKPPSERTAFLERECAGHPQLRSAVEALLAAHGAPGRHPLDQPPPAPGEATDHPEGQPSRNAPLQSTADYSQPVAGGSVIAGRYALLEKIGEGGMGEVWVARQAEPVKRKVALKLIRLGMDSRAVIQRFEQERQALALMDHPHIAKVFDGGITNEGRPFFVMELVNGLPLTKFCDEAKLGIRERLELFVPICQAVQHAHQKGIVHRDLKPSNILVTLLDGRPIPKVIDFGVAKATGGKLTDQTLSTQFGAVVGTFEYMSPEQAGYSAADVDTRADIYSLGVVLYELLTGLKPFDDKRLREAALDEMIRIIREEEPSKPSTRLSTDAAFPSLAAVRQIEPARLTKLLRGELDWVVMKCLEKQRDRRYETASALAREVQHYLADETVEARPPSTAYRFRKFLRRHKGPVLATSIVFLALVGGVIGTTLGLVEAKRQEGLAIEAQQKESRRATSESTARRDEKAQREKAERQTAIAASALKQESAAKQSEAKERLKAERQLRIATAERLAATSHAKRPQSPSVSLALAIESARATQIDEECLLPSSHQALLDALGEIGGLPLVGHNDVIDSVAITSDGHWIVTASKDHTVRVWDLTAENPAANSRILFGDSTGVSAAAVSADSRWIAAADSSGIRIWDLTATNRAAEPRILYGDQGTLALKLVITNDGRRIVGADLDGSARLWDIAEPLARPRILTGHRGPITCAAVSSDDHWLVTGSNDATLRVWDLTSIDPGVEPRVLTGHTESITSIAISPDNRWLVTGSEDQSARVWDLVGGDSGAMPRVLAGHQRSIGCVGISPNGRWIVTGAENTRVWDLTAEDPTVDPSVLNEHRSAVRSIAFSHDSRTLVTASWDKTAMVWDITSTNPAAKFRLAGHSSEVDCVAISPDGRWVVTGGRDNVPRVWDLRAEKLAVNPLVVRVERPHIQSVAVSPDGRWMVVAGEEARVWNLKARNPLASSRLLEGYHGMVQCLAISPDSGSVVAGCHDNSVRIWGLGLNLRNRNPRVLTGHSGLIFDITVSPDARWIVTGGADKSARLWDSRAEDPASMSRVLGEHRRTVTRVKISPDSRWAVTLDGAAHLWDLKSEDPSARPHVLTDGPLTMIQCAAISPDSRWIATGSADGIVRVWDLTSPDPAANPLLFPRHQAGIYAVGFSPDGRWLATGSADKTARVWDFAGANPAANPRILPGHLAVIRHVGFSPDSRWIFTGSDDRTARIWDLAAANPGLTSRVLHGHGSSVSGLVIAPDGRRCITWSYDRRARIWHWQWDDLVELSGEVGRNLGLEEWQEYFPNEPYRKTFRGLPVPGAPERAAEYLLRGRARLLRLEPDSAREDFTAAIRVDPTMADAYAERGNLFFSRGDLDKALNDCNEAVRVSPRLYEALILRSGIWVRKGTLDKGLADLIDAIQLAPNNSIAYLHRAKIYSSAADPRFRNGNQAIADGKKACELTNWRNGASIAILAAAFAEAGNFEDAIKWQTNALELTPEGFDELRSEFQQQLELYRAGKPYRDPGIANTDR